MAHVANGPSMTNLCFPAVPNGRKVSIALEALGLGYLLQAPDLSTNAGKTPAFLAINPNGHIPASVEHAAGQSLKGTQP